jgi:hypothetical protein
MQTQLKIDRIKGNTMEEENSGITVVTNSSNSSSTVEQSPDKVILSNSEINEVKQAD